MIVKSQRDAYSTNLSDFYTGWKQEINALVKKPFMNKYTISDNEFLKGVSALKERKKKKLLLAMDGINMDEKVKQIYNGIYY